MKITKKQEKAERERINKLYGLSCHGIQVPIFSLSGIMDAGLAALRAGGDDEAIKAALRTKAGSVAVNP